MLCPQCRRERRALAAEEGDDHPRPPAGALRPDYPHFEALAAWLQGDQLCEAIGVADEQPALFRLHNDRQREAFVAAMAAEVLRRLERRRGAA